MPLDVNIIAVEIQKMTDEEIEGFVGYPSEPGQIGANWGAAINTFAGVNVLPLSTTGEEAKEAFIAIMKQITDPVLADAKIKAAFSTYATVLAGGMLPAFIAVPPPAPIDFTSVALAGFSGASARTCSKLLATIIITWFKTGLATPSGGGPAIPWA